jgi:hypothetical protein
VAEAQATLGARRTSASRAIVDPLLIAVVALGSTVAILATNGLTLPGLVLVGALLAGWSSAWSP